MLIRFKASNFLSILDEQELCLFPSRVRSKPEHVYKTKGTRLPDILKSAIIYGPNASGKSNLIKAMAFSRDLISAHPLGGNIKNNAFQLAEKNERPTTFEYEVLLNEKYYSFGFKIEEDVITDEWLKQILGTKEKSLYRRTTVNGNVKVDFNLTFSTKDAEKFHKTICIGTKSNQLFINFINEQNPNTVEPIFKEVSRWFRNNLKIIFPQTKFNGLEIELLRDKELWKFYNSILKQLDTGVDELRFEEISFDDPKFTVPEPIKQDIKRQLEKNNMLISVASMDNERFAVSRTEKGLKVLKLKATHYLKGTDKVVHFEFRNESDGTNRILDLIPLLYMAKQGHTVIIDELDRSFHALVTEKIFKLFYNKSEGTPSQIIATTHDISLLDLKNFRRDEIWFIKKGKQQESLLYSLEEFRPRFDKELKNAYLDGRFGAIPIISRSLEQEAHAF